MTAADVQIVFVSGLSGSGKTTAMAAIEDLSFYCVDNLPAQLIEQFLDLCAKSTPPIQKIALAIDAREAEFLRDVPAAVENLRARGAEVQLIFLECSNENLMNRYRETRRVHPLSPGGPVEDGIETERRLLAEVSRLADFVVDTSALNIHQLRETVVGFVAGGARPTVVNMISFGFRYGAPSSAELLFDVRFLPNPHFEPSLRPKRARLGADGSASGAPGVSPSVVRRRGEALSHRGDRLHGRPSPLGGGSGRPGEGAPRHGARRERDSQGRGEGVMKVGVLIVAHYRLGQEMLQALRLIVPNSPRFHAVGIEPKQSVDEMRSAITEALAAADSGEGVLILTDMFGGTPSNISLSFLKEHRIEVVTGINLPMLIKLATLTEDKPVEELAAFIKEYGRRNISVASELLPEGQR
jgi:RNase adaptor protein for sRNA GlmZ degradation/mannose/fructose-specific phosphotransferase system component IIA